MGRRRVVMLPALQRLVSDLGENIRLARLRRRLSQEQLAQRAGITRPTLRGLENGEGSVSLGVFAQVLFCLGIEKDLALVGLDDRLGRKLQDAGLPARRRSPKQEPTCPG